uniref:Secreted protein n=1 Tax=Anguilla anguilla TaxID=7936 RepID=A0A0E9UGE5_ANGAN
MTPPPLSQSSFTLTLWGFLCTVTGCRWEGSRGMYSPKYCSILHTPSAGLKFTAPFLQMDSLATPTTQ